MPPISEVFEPVSARLFAVRDGLAVTPPPPAGLPVVGAVVLGGTVVGGAVVFDAEALALGDALWLAEADGDADALAEADGGGQDSG